MKTPPRDGYSAVVTAGAPGAGKSTALTHFRGDDLTGFRVLDSDIVKHQLIEQAVRDGIYDDILATPLADGHPVAPRELAALVHHESTQPIDQIRRICTSRRENIVIEGTLSWKGLPSRLAAELTEADYRSIEVIRSTLTEAPVMSKPSRAGGQAADDGLKEPTPSVDASHRPPPSTSATATPSRRCVPRTPSSSKNSPQQPSTPAAPRSYAAPPPIDSTSRSNGCTRTNNALLEQISI